MVNGRFVDVEKIAEASGCDVGAAYQVAGLILESLHKSALINGLSGSLHEAMMCISTDAAYHLGGIYGAIGDKDMDTDVSETLLRMPPYDDYYRCRDEMDAWEKTLTEEQRYFVQMARRKDG